MAKKARRSAAAERRPSAGRKTALHPIHTDQVLDFLDELQMLVRSSLETLRSATDVTGRAGPKDMRSHLDRFREEAESRVEMIASTIRELGGNPGKTGSAARVQAQRGFALTGIIAPSHLRLVNAFENCWNASIEEDLHITFLRSVAPYAENPHVTEALEDSLAPVREAHDARLEWLEQTLHRLLLQRILQPLDENDDEGFPEVA